MSIDDNFNEQKAREIVNILLKNDISIYRKLLPEIQNLNSKDFQNLFEGVDDYDFNVKNKKIFQKLCIKFNNFQVILEEWYKNPKYLEYLKELWIRYPCIENLRDKNENDFEEALKSYSINYINWPSDVKSEFKTLVSNTQDTKAFELKQIIEDKFSEINSVLEELILFKNTMKKQGDEGNIYSKNSLGIFQNIISTIVIPLVGFAGYDGFKNIGLKEIKNAKKIICSKYTNKKRAEFIANDFIRIIEEKKCTGCYDYIDNHNRLHELNLNCKNGKLNNLNMSKKLKTFFKSKMVCGLHAALSFLNLGWSIYELNKTFKGFEEIKNYKIKLEEIVGLFNIHKKEIGILPEDFEEAAIRIKNVLDKIRQDQKNLKNLMLEIRNSIKIQNSQKNKSIIGLVTSGVLGVFGVVGSIVTFNGVSLVYGISSCANVLSAIGHTTNIVMANKIINGFNEVLDRAIEEEKKIQDEIDLLINELTERIQQEPKFELNATISSISTNFDIDEP